MIFPDTRDAARDWVAKALDEEGAIKRAPFVTEADVAHICQMRADALIAIAGDYEVTIEELIGWIRFPAPDKRWSTREFLRWAQKLVDLRRELERLQEREAAEQRKICQQCWSHVAQRVGPRWICTNCGEVE